VQLAIFGAEKVGTANVVMRYQCIRAMTIRLRVIVWLQVVLVRTSRPITTYRKRCSPKMSQQLVAQAKKVHRLGYAPIPIIAGPDKKPPSWFAWTDLRDGRRPALTDQEIEVIFSNPDVSRVGILLNRRSLLIDYDGPLGHQMLWSELMPRCSPELQRELRSTTHTKTPHGGHILVLLDETAFPDGIEEMLCWQLLLANNGHGVSGNGNGNGHAEIRILSQNKYSVEYGQDYEPIVDIQQVVTLSKEASIELVEICRQFKSESMAIRNVAGSIMPYWIKDRRQDLALAIPGYLYKNKVGIDVARHLIQYLTQLTGDEEASKRLDAVNSTYNKDAKDVSGYTRLMELIDENESIIQKIEQQFSKLGYDFYNGNGKGTNTSQKKQKDDDKPKLSAEVIELLRPRINLLFKDDSGTAFAAIHVNGHLEIVTVHKCKRFDLWIRRMYYELSGDTLGSEIISEVAETLESEALFEGPTKKLEPRINKDPDDPTVYWYDRGTEEWDAIRITPNGWSIVESQNVPIVFRRYAGQLPQVVPVKDYPKDIFEQFMKLLNIKDDLQIRLVYECYVIALLIPTIAKAIFIAQGPQGATKTTFQDLTKLVTDPSKVTNVTPPRTEEQLMQLLQHNAIIYFDNMSRMPEWLSNALCRAATGTAGLKRELYTNDDDIIYQYKRAIGFNGIALAANRADLLDRSFIVEIESVTDETRRTLEDDIMPELERIKPQLFGFILDTLVKMLHLKANGGIKLKSLSRMADFEKHCEMISQCLGHKPLEFVSAYRSNKNIATKDILENSSVANAVIEFMKYKNAWTGYASNFMS
jgi:hypothetical protein